MPFLPTNTRVSNVFPQDPLARGRPQVLRGGDLKFCLGRLPLHIVLVCVADGVSLRGKPCRAGIAPWEPWQGPLQRGLRFVKKIDLMTGHGYSRLYGGARRGAPVLGAWWWRRRWLWWPACGRVEVDMIGARDLMKGCHRRCRRSFTRTMSCTRIGRAGPWVHGVHLEQAWMG
jgi:hypothetical protein